MSTRKVAIIVSKGGMDEVYPSLILASGARQSGIDVAMFFTFYGLDAITEDKVDHLHVNMTGNASSPMPTVVAGLPGMEAVAAKMMKKQLDDLEIPPVREMIEMIADMGGEVYACELAMKMFKLERDDLIRQVKGVLTVGDFYGVSEGAQIIYT